VAEIEHIIRATRRTSAGAQLYQYGRDRRAAAAQPNTPWCKARQGPTVVSSSSSSSSSFWGTIIPVLVPSTAELEELRPRSPTHHGNAGRRRGRQQQQQLRGYQAYQCLAKQRYKADCGRTSCVTAVQGGPGADRSAALQQQFSSSSEVSGLPIMIMLVPSSRDAGVASSRQ
jgi:hypothetical protein